MNSHQRGKLVLIEIPDGNVKRKALAYLLTLMSDASPESLTAKLKNTPLILSKNISAQQGQNIAASLEDLGAYAVFLPFG